MGRPGKRRRQAHEPNKARQFSSPVGWLCMHFGHCEQFALVDVDDAGRTIAGTTYITPPAHEPGALPRWLHEPGANVIITGGMGQRAQGLFSQNGISRPEIAFQRGGR